MKGFGPLWAVTTAFMINGLVSAECGAAGVTVITHGFVSDGSLPGWVPAMADQIPNCYWFRGTNFTTYRIAVTYNSSDGNYYISSNRTNGISPAATDSGEIFVELDWSSLSGDVFDSVASTYSVAWPVAWALMQTNLIADMGGHALAEYPIHLIGHSRGGSLMSEVSNQLGMNGIWVDHLTTLDPYPINNDGNFDFPATLTDATASNTYSSVLFADNYWQDLGIGYAGGDPDGESVSGAYVRQLYDLSGGYGSDHSNVHLWYHGTIDFSHTPTTDGSASITSSERQNWWVPYEDYMPYNWDGIFAGFYYSLIAGGDRTSAARPVGTGFPSIRDGYNQYYAVGAGQANPNRTPLTSNTGEWPNLIRLNRLDTNAVAQGQSTTVAFYYQWANTSAGNAGVNFYLDNDFNPLNGNSKLIKQIIITSSGANTAYYLVPLTLDAVNASPGNHSLYASVTAGGHTRYLYAPERVQVVLPSRQPPTLDMTRLNPTQLLLGVNGVAGQTIVLQGSGDLRNWLPLATNYLTTSRLTYTVNPVGIKQSYYRAVLQ